MGFSRLCHVRKTGVKDECRTRKKCGCSKEISNEKSQRAEIDCHPHNYIKPSCRRVHIAVYEAVNSMKKMLSKTKHRCGFKGIYNDFIQKRDGR